MMKYLEIHMNFEIIEKYINRLKIDTSKSGKALFTKIRPLFEFLNRVHYQLNEEDIVKLLENPIFLNLFSKIQKDQNQFGEYKNDINFQNLWEAYMEMNGLEEENEFSLERL